MASYSTLGSIVSPHLLFPELMSAGAAPDGSTPSKYGVGGQVSQQTQIALIGVGLTRTSAIALSELITSDSMTESQVLRWLDENEAVWRNVSLPILVKKEIDRVLAQHQVRP